MDSSGFSIMFQGVSFLRLLKGLWVTIQLALISSGLSIVLGTLLGFLLKSRHKAVRIICLVYVDIMRILPQLVLLFAAYYGTASWFGLNLSAWNAAVIVFTMWGTAEMGDLVRGALESIPKHQYESAEALGMTSAQTFRYVILPQTLRRLAAPSVNLVTRMIKTTSLVEIIGMVEVLKTGQQIIDANRIDYPSGAFWVYGMVFLMYFLICWPISIAAKRLERKWS
ncbi:MAG: amino acid ABC transporter permease [Bulleidia sp.]|nr:amino acid ABC transporter permease [Bulleidia sp.]